MKSREEEEGSREGKEKGEKKDGSIKGVERKW